MAIPGGAGIQEPPMEAPQNRNCNLIQVRSNQMQEGNLSIGGHSATLSSGVMNLLNLAGFLAAMASELQPLDAVRTT
jgi:hypothetical protein